MKEKHDEPARGQSTAANDKVERDDDVIRIEDLAPRGNVTGGRKILLGEMFTPASSPRIVPES